MFLDNKYKINFPVQITFLGWLTKFDYGLVVEDSLRTFFKIQCTPPVSHVFCMLSPFDKNALG